MAKQNLTWHDIMQYESEYNKNVYGFPEYHCDADGNQIMIDYDLQFDTVNLSKQEYETIERILDSVSFKFKNFEVYIGYDVSGYHYWTEIMEEPIRPYIAIRARKDWYIPSSELVHRYTQKCIDILEKRLDKAGIDPWYREAA